MKVTRALLAALGLLLVAPISSVHSQDAFLPVGSGQQKRLKDMGDGTHAEVVVSPSYDPVGGKELVGTAQERFFASTIDTSAAGLFDLIELDPSITVTTAMGGTAAGSSAYTQISSGTNPNARYVALSRSIFRAPVDLRVQVTASQRILNNNLRIGFVEVDPVTGAMIADATIVAAPGIMNARNAAILDFSPTSPTAGGLLTRMDGSAVDTTATNFGAGFTTAATGTGPDWLASTTYGLALERDRVSARAWGMNSTANTGGQFSTDRVIPNPSRTYKIIVMMFNGSTAPASSTDWRIHLINAMDATRFDVSPRNAGTSDLAKAFPVVGSVTATVSSSSSNEDQVLAASVAPYIVGGVARTGTTAGTIINNDAVRQTMTLEGASVTQPYAVPDLNWSASLSLTSTTAVAIQTAGGAGLKRHLTSLWAVNTCGTATDLVVLDGTTERVRYTLIPNVPTPVTFPTGIPVTANTALNANLSAACTVRANFLGYTAK